MSQSLGEKLRQAREEKGISISEVAEQTRISSLYLESIENDDYKPLPGGIFNKGFVKSYAKFVGVDEHEALQDYANLVAASDPEPELTSRSYRPEVLTDDRAVTSLLPTILFAAVILALMTAGILFVVNYIQNRQAEPDTAANTNAGIANSNANTQANVNTAPEPPAPAFDSATFEFRAENEPVSLRAVVDGRGNERLIQAGQTVSFTPKKSLVLSYARARAQYSSLTINGKPITLPTEPANPNRVAVEVEINQDNFEEIWRSGSIPGTPSASLGPGDASAERTAAGRSAESRPVLN